MRSSAFIRSDIYDCAEALAEQVAESYGVVVDPEDIYALANKFTDQAMAWGQETQDLREGVR